MSIATQNNCIDQIGLVAGQVWRCLSNNGSMSIAKLVKNLEMPRDQVMQGVGWLAREDKVVIVEKSRSRTISLIEE